MPKQKRIPPRAAHASKKRKGSAAALPAYSEVEDESFAGTSDSAPPKSAVKTHQPLVFPMERDSPALPRCDGPKMQSFSNRDVKVNFIRELGDGHSAVHSNVFEVKINGVRYALKMFRTCGRGSYYKRDLWRNIFENPPELRVVADYFKPFYQECRAYARIAERGLQRRYWRCYGYLRLPPSLRQQLCDITGLPEYYWQVRLPEINGRTDKPSWTLPDHLNWPIYGLVKELASYKFASNPKQRNVRTMYSDLKQLHKAGIVVMDVADRNYIAGRIVDFSLALTLPHIWFSLPKTKAEHLKDDVCQMGSFDDKAERDKYIFREMILETGRRSRLVPSINSEVYLNTRGVRGMRPRLASPLYELGVNEPEIPDPDASTVYSV